MIANRLFNINPSDGFLSSPHWPPVEYYRFEGGIYEMGEKIGEISNVVSCCVLCIPFTSVFVCMAKTRNLTFGALLDGS